MCDEEELLEAELLPDTFTTCCNCPHLSSATMAIFTTSVILRYHKPALRNIRSCLLHLSAFAGIEARQDWHGPAQSECCSKVFAGNSTVESQAVHGLMETRQT